MIKIPISNNATDKEILDHLSRGGYVRLGSIGYLKMKKWPDRNAFHNNTGKKRIIKGYRKLVFIQDK